MTTRRSGPSLSRSSPPGFLALTYIRSDSQLHFGLFIDVTDGRYAYFRCPTGVLAGDLGRRHR